MQLWSETTTRIWIRRIIAASTLFALIGGDVQIALAQTSLFNKQVNYQAKLMTPAGVAVPDGTYNLWFRLYLSPAGATTSNIWEEQYIGANKVSVANGLLSVMLGTQTSLAGLNWNQPLYLGVEIGGSTTPAWDGEMSPRKLLGAVPAAFTAETLSGLTANQFVRTDATSTIASSSAQTLLTLNQNGAGNILDLKANNISLATFLANGNVGIGTSSPYARLSVAGQVVAAYFTGTSTATSTFGGGVNITSGCYAVGGSCLSASSASSTLLSDANIFSGANIFANVIRSTTTAATTTNFFATIASSTGLFAAFAQFGTLITLGSSTFQDFTALHATATSLAITGSATSTFGSGINLQAGCFSIGGTCLTSGGSAVGGTGAIQFANGSAFTGDNTQFFFDNTTKSLALGTSTAFARLSLQGVFSSQQALFDIASSTNSSGSATTSVFRVNANGNVGIGVTAPTNALDVRTSLAGGDIIRVQNDNAAGYSNYTAYDNGNNQRFAVGFANSAAGIAYLANRAFTWVSSGTSYVIAEQNTGAIATFASGGNVGIGTTSPYSMLSVAGQVVGQNFVATSTTAVSSFQQLLANGSTTLQNFTALRSTTTNATTTSLAVTGSATSTFASGIQISSGCFSIAGTCLSAGSGASTTLLANNNTFSGQNVFSGATTSFSNAITVGAGQGTSTFAGGLSTTRLNVTSGTSTFANGIVLSSGCFRDTSATSTCIGKGQAATYVVAASNSKNKQYADYIADGTGDQNEIQAAINAAYTSSRGLGGRVYLLEGDYSISGTTTMATGTMLVGSGAGTVLRVANTTNTNIAVFYANYSSGLSVTNMTLLGNKANQGAFLHAGIKWIDVSTSTIANVGLYSFTDDNIQMNEIVTNKSVYNHVDNVTSVDSTQAGMYLICLNCTVTNSHINNNQNGGIAGAPRFSYLSNLAVLYNSTVGVNVGAGATVVNSDVYGTTGLGVGVSVSSYEARVTNNNISNNIYGITVDGVATDAVITGNTISSNNVAVFLNSVPRVTITGNSIYANVDGGVYISAGSGHTITGNIFVDNSTSGAIASAIELSGGTTDNIVSGNSITKSSASGATFAIRIDGTSLRNYVSGNTYSGAGARSISDWATSSTRYTQWDRLTLDTRQLGTVAYSPLSIFASSSVALASTTQMGTGKILSLLNSLGEQFTVANSGAVGIGSSTPSALFGLSTRDPLYIASTTASSTFANGINLLSGCFSVGGTCISAAGTSAIGGTGAIQFANGSAFAGDNTRFFFDNTTKSLAIGTSTAFAKLTLQGAYGSQQALFDIASSTNSSGSATTSVFRVNANGSVGIGTTTADARYLGYALTVSGINPNSGVMLVQNTSSAGYSDIGFIDQLGIAGGFVGYGNGSVSASFANSMYIGDGGVNARLLLNPNVNDGNVAVGTTSPYAKLTLWSSSVIATNKAFEVANSASTTLFNIFDNGKIGIATSSPSSNFGFSVGTTTYLAGGTTTAANGIQLLAGCYRNATGSCVGGGKESTYIVAAYNSPGRAYADYQADYVNDQVEINQAITAAYSASRGRGGRVYLLDGDFRVGTSSANGTSINMATSTQLLGSGPGTVVTVASSTPGDINVINFGTSTNNLVVSDFTIDGNRLNQSMGNHSAVMLNTLLSSSTIQNLTIKNFRTAGVNFQSNTSGYAINIINNRFENDQFAVAVDGLDTSYIKNNQTIGGVFTLTHIYNTLVSGNIIDATGVVGANPGIMVSGSDNIIVNNQILNSTGYGIWNSFADHTLITGNNIYNSQYSGIIVSNSNDVTMTGNYLSGNLAAGVGLSLGSIEMFSSQRTIVNGNSIAGAGVAGPVALYIDQTASSSIISNNSYSGVGALSITDWATSSTKYTQWDRLTLDTKSLGTVAYSPLSIFASSSVALASTTQMGTGKVLSLNTATSGEVFTVANNGNVGIGSSTPSALFGLSMRNPLYVASTTASSTFANGINLLAGCFSVGGTCLTSGGGSSSGISGAIQFSNGASGFSSDATKLFFDNSNKALALGTSTAWAKLTLQGTYGSTSALFDVASTTNASGSATTSFFRILGNGNIGVGTTSPYARLSVAGDIVSASISATSSTAISRVLNRLDVGTSAVGMGGPLALNVMSAGSNTGIGFRNDGMGEAFIVFNTSTAGLALGTGTADPVTIAPGANTTAYFGSDGLIGLGTSSPFARVTIWALGTTTGKVFEVANSASTSLFSIFDNGKIGIATSSPSNNFGFSVGTTTYFAGGTTTAANGIQLLAGCFRDATGTCVGGGAAADGKAATYIVAASNSIGAAYADYQADGTADQVEINAAIVAAYSSSRGLGGKVYLLEGDYSVNGTTTMATGTQLVGSGAGTVVRVANNTNLTFDMFVAQGGSNINMMTGVELRDFRIDGNQENQSSGTVGGISLSYVASSTIGSMWVGNLSDIGVWLGETNESILITKNHLYNLPGGAITSDYVGVSSGVLVNDNVITDIGTYGIHPNGAGHDHWTISNNIILRTNEAIAMNNGVANSSVIGNTIDSTYAHAIWTEGSGNTISGNVISNGNYGYQLGVIDVADNTIVSSNNIITTSGYAIVLNGGGNTVTGNSITNDQKTAILLNASTNVVSGNYINGYALGGTGSAIQTSNSSNNTIIGNSIVNTPGTLGYAIYLDSSSLNNFLTGNTYFGGASSTIADFATSSTRYTQWDRLTLDTKSLGTVAYSPLSIFASSSVALASTTQMGTGKIMSLNNSTGEKFTISNLGAVGIGSSTPSALFGLSVLNPLYVASTTASSTFANGINLQAGCFSVGGTCISAGSGTVNSGTTGQLPYYAANGTALTATSSIFLATTGNVGVGTTSPLAKLDVFGSIRGNSLVVTASSTLYSTLSSYGGFNGFVNFSGGIGNGGSDSVLGVQRLTQYGNLVNIGSIQAGELNISSGGTFSAKVDITTGSTPYSVAIGDLNGDGKQDLAVANNGGTSVSVLLNNGNGTYAAKVDYTTGAGPWSVAIGDFNGDGKQDLAVANNTPGTISILMNNGNGTFATKVDYTTGGGPLVVDVGDLNGDGMADLAVTANTATRVYVHLNNGNGTFATPSNYVTAASPYSVAIGDVNGDGRADLAVTNSSATSFSIFMNNGNGTFASKADYVANAIPISVTMGDVNGDGKQDVAVANYNSDNISVYTNNGNGTFAAKVDYPVNTNPRGVAMGDLNGDGKLDLAVAHFGVSSASVFLNNGDGTFATKVDYTIGANSWGVAIGDLNSDGKADLAVANSGGTSVSTLMNISSPSLYVQGSTGNVSLGTSSPWAKLSIQSSYGNQNGLFDIASTTGVNGSATTSLFRVNANGNIGIGTSSPYSTLSVVGQVVASFFTGTTTSTSSFGGPVIITGTTTIGIPGQTATSAALIIGYGSICVDNDGTCTPTTTGQISARGYNSGGSDLAENYFATSSVEAGDLIELAGTSTFVQLASHAERTIGIVSTAPGMTLGADLDESFTYRKVPVALSGRVPVKVNLENGPIHVGDRITLSSRAGVGARATATSSVFVAVAMEDWSGDQQNMDTMTPGVILGFVSTKYQDLSAHIAGSQIDLTSTSTGEVVPIFALASDNASVRYVADRPFDLGGAALVNVKSLMSSSGKWSLDEAGKLVVETLEVKGNTKIGTDAAPSGVTLFDKVSGAPYCIQMIAGVLTSVQGECGIPGMSSSASIGAPSAIPPPTPTDSGSSTPPDTGSTTPSVVPPESSALPPEEILPPSGGSSTPPII